MLLEAWLALTRFNYHRNVLVSTHLKLWLALTMLCAIGPGGLHFRRSLESGSPPQVSAGSFPETADINRALVPSYCDDHTLTSSLARVTKVSKYLGHYGVSHFILGKVNETRRQKHQHLSGLSDLALRPASGPLRTDLLGDHNVHDNIVAALAKVVNDGCHLLPKLVAFRIIAYVIHIYQIKMNRLLCHSRGRLVTRLPTHYVHPRAIITAMDLQSLLGTEDHCLGTVDR